MKSMTGFGKAMRVTDAYQIEVEIKSVNHRFLDVQLRTSRQLHAYENQIRQVIKETLHRGRVEVFVTLTQRSDLGKEVMIHWDLLEQVVTSVEHEVQARFQTTIQRGPFIEGLLEKETFMEMNERMTDDDSLEYLLLAVVTEATRANDQSRQLEGRGILSVLQENQQLLQHQIQELSQFFATFEQEYQSRFEKKLNDYLGATIDQDRLLTEMVILLERSDIQEELDRLTIHLENLQQLFVKPQPVGRELDFLIQEINREINTIGSKSTAIEMKNIVVQMKTIIEKIREQVQNIE